MLEIENKKMKLRLLIYSFLICPFISVGQPLSSFDIGAGFGVSSHFGDINQETLFYEANFGTEFFLRYIFNDRYAIRGNILVTRLSGNDRDFNNRYQQTRNKSFDTGVFEAGLIGEVNLFPYNNPATWGTNIETIYMLGGVAATNTYGESRNGVGRLAVIVGVGYKRELGNRFAIEAEWAFRKLFTDELDGVDNPHNFEQPLLFNKDWYHFLSIKLSYNIFNFSGKCRTFEKHQM